MSNFVKFHLFELFGFLLFFSVPATNSVDLPFCISFQFVCSFLIYNIVGSFEPFFSILYSYAQFSFSFSVPRHQLFLFFINNYVGSFKPFVFFYLFISTPDSRFFFSVPRHQLSVFLI